MGLGFISEYLSEDEENIESFNYKTPTEIVDGLLVHSKTLLDASGVKKEEIYIKSDEITTIGRSAFSKCKGVRAIVVDKPVNGLCPNAFCAMDGVETVNLSDSFISTISRGCFVASHELKEIILPKRVDEICSWAFYDCLSLENISIPNSVDYIGANAFADCKNLRTIRFYGEPSFIHNNAFQGTNTIRVQVPPSSTRLKHYFEVNYPLFIIENIF